MMEGLGEMLWQAQRYNLPPDPATYLNILRKKKRACQKPEYGDASAFYLCHRHAWPGFP